MISQKLEHAVNDQIQLELQASYLYLAMSALCEARYFRGFARWLRAQSREEYGHAMKLFDLMGELGAPIDLKAISAPAVQFDSLRALFQEVYAHEKKVTASIHHLYALALEQKDYPAQPLLQWFVTEQVEEENAAAEICHKLDWLEDHPMGLFALDRELGGRSAGEVSH
ncbi:MAG: ferritin [Planctomycetes bacterium]|nr:ferritin [Planctomycetota bacterium]